MKTDGGTLRMDEYELSKCMAQEVSSNLFMSRMMLGGACFIFLSLSAWGFYIQDHGLSHLLPPWRDFFHLIPWIILVSLLVALFLSSGFGFTDKAIKDTLRQLAKENNCRELSVNIKTGPY